MRGAKMARYVQGKGDGLEDRFGRTSQNSVMTKFGECPFHALRCISLAAVESPP